MSPSYFMPILFLGFRPGLYQMCPFQGTQVFWPSVAQMIG